MWIKIATMAVSRHRGPTLARRARSGRRVSRRLAVRSVAAPTREGMESGQGDVAGERFVWARHWYPVAPLTWLEEAQGDGFESGLPEVQRMAILGRDIVVWKDGEGAWRAVEDRCPHRLAALSLGSVQEDGTLACRYHGWCFNGKGECTHIPQATDATSEATACSSVRSKVQAFPTLTAHGLLWVWPDDSASAWIDSAVEPPLVGPNIDKLNIKSMYELPSTYTSYLENSLDPSHVNFLHDGLGNYSPTNAMPIADFEVKGDITANGGFTLRHSAYAKSNDGMQATRRFRPPCLNSGEYDLPNKSKMLFELYFVPTRPGFVRVMGDINFVPGSSTLPPRRSIIGMAALLWTSLSRLPLRFMEMLVPDFVVASLGSIRSGLFFQDAIANRSIDVAFSRSGKTWQQLYFLPTPSDVGVSAFRQWINRFSDGQPDWFCGGSDQEATAKVPESDLYDRWNGYGKYSPSIRKSLKFFGNMESTLSAAAIGLLGLAAIVAARAANLNIAVAGAAVAGACLLARFEVQKLRNRLLTGIPSCGMPEVPLKWPSTAGAPTAEAGLHIG